MLHHSLDILIVQTRGATSTHEASLLSMCLCFLLRETGVHQVAAGSDNPGLWPHYSPVPAPGLQLPNWVHPNGANSYGMVRYAGTAVEMAGKWESFSRYNGGWHLVSKDMFSVVVDFIIQLMTFRNQKKRK